jgi:hypothetical protein
VKKKLSGQWMRRISSCIEDAMDSHDSQDGVGVGFQARRRGDSEKTFEAEEEG